MVLIWLAAEPSLALHHGIQLWLTLSALTLFLLLGNRRRFSDWITLARTVAVIATLILAGASALSTVAVAVAVGLALALDRIDGSVARIEGETDAGAALDMESDQLVVFSMAAYAVAANSHPIWALLLPMFKYLDCLLRLGWNMPAGAAKPNPDGNLRARMICAFTMVSLYGAVTPILPGALASSLTAFSVGLLGWSFYEDLRWQRLSLKERARA